MYVRHEDSTWVLFDPVKNGQQWDDCSRPTARKLNLDLRSGPVTLVSFDHGRFLRRVSFRRRRSGVAYGTVSTIGLSPKKNGKIDQNSLVNSP